MPNEANFVEISSKEVTNFVALGVRSTMIQNACGNIRDTGEMK